VRLSPFFLFTTEASTVAFMRLSSFLFISIALHTTVLTYPFVFPSYHRQDLVPVVVLSIDDGSGDTVRGNGTAEGANAKPTGLKHRALVREAELRDSELEYPTESRDPSKISLAADTPAGIALVAGALPSTETVGNFSIEQANGSGGEGGSGRQGISGLGTGSGIGRGDGGRGSTFVQVSYTYNPKPEYLSGRAERAKKVKCFFES